MNAGEGIDSLVDRFEKIQKELVELLHHVKEAKNALERSSGDLSSAGEALSSIGEVTEKAAHNLLGLVERLLASEEEAAPHFEALEAGLPSGPLRQALEGVEAVRDERALLIGEMMSELSFQDLTCQSLEKVKRGLGELEQRILSLLDPESVSPPSENDGPHAGSMSGLSRLREAQDGASRQDLVDLLLGG